ncbi:MAG: hypothetical protein E6Q89_06030 [Bacteroidia bacterium]|nr:MAG: hypothetical protein E6Q89_06030 [Bacteroidia bacterium]
MKTFLITSRLIAIFLVLTFGLTSCNKSDLTNDDETEASQGLNIAEIEDDNTQIMADQAESSGSVSDLRLISPNDNSDADILGGCAVVTKDTVSSPKSITIDFGDGCTGPGGKVRKGKIIITYTGAYRAPGTAIHVVSENYFVNDKKIDIDKTIKNLGPNEQGNLVFDVQAERIVTFPNGSSNKSTVHKRREWLAGASTPLDFSDDIFRVIGEGTHISRRGVTYQVHTLTALIRKVSCHEFVSGELKIVRQADNRRFAIINFGTGECDDEATVTLDNGRSFTIDLRH